MPPLENSSCTTTITSEKVVVDENNNNQNDKTVINQPEDSAMYVRCDSQEPFVNPFDTGKTPEEINETELNLNLGMGNEMNNYINFDCFAGMFDLFGNLYVASLVEKLFRRLWNAIPIHIHQKIIYTMWNLYFTLHKFLFGRSTGIHPSQSFEFHALSTIGYIGNFVPVTVSKMRFSLDQMTACCPTDLQTSKPERIEEDMTKELVPYIPEVQKNFCTVTGMYLHHRPGTQDTNPPPTEYTLIWMYGGAFMAGSAEGNMGPADIVGTNCGMDVFIPNTRLCPEYQCHDYLWDTALAYRYIYKLKEQRGQDPSKIFLLGISSGCGLVTRLLQFFGELERNEIILPSYIAHVLTGLQKPKGGVLCSPFVDYSDDKNMKGTFFHYCKHDMIVNDQVIKTCVPFLETHLNGERNQHSPKVHSFQGVAPMCVIVSEHEACYDEAIEVVNKARAAGVFVTVGMWRYMCHSFLFFFGFIPEGRHAMNLLCSWINEQKEA